MVAGGSLRSAIGPNCPTSIVDNNLRLGQPGCESVAASQRMMKRRQMAFSRAEEVRVVVERQGASYTKERREGHSQHRVKSHVREMEGSR